MMKCNVRTLEDAFLYLADCQLATVSDMAHKKSRPKGEYGRQKRIADFYCDWARQFKLKIDPISDSRIHGALVAGVDAWAKKQERS